MCKEQLRLQMEECVCPWDAVKSTILNQGDYPGLSRGSHCNLKGPWKLKREAEESEWEKWWHKSRVMWEGPNLALLALETAEGRRKPRSVDSLRGWNRQGNRFACRAHRKECNTLILPLWDSRQTGNLQNSNKLHLYIRLCNNTFLYVP